MAKIFAFPQSGATAQTAQDDLEMFVDDGELLEFAPSDDEQEKRPFRQNFGWTNQECADLYRAHALIQAARPGLECDQGVSDEGDPWFLIGDQQGDVFIHICRINGLYVVDSVTLPQVLTGKDFKSLIDDFLLTATDKDQKAAEPANVIRLTRGGTVCLHPSMMIAALIWTILLEIDELALPVANSLNDQNEGESSAQDISLEPDLATTISMIDSQIILNQEDSATPTTGWNDELGQIQRDEKAVHASTSSAAYALTTVATAAGLYTGAQALNVLWGLTETEESPSGIADTTEKTAAHSGAVTFNPLADALAILSDVGEFDFVERVDKNISEMLSTLDATLTLPDTETLQANINSEVFTDASVLLYRLDLETSLNHADAMNADAMNRTIEASGADVVMTKSAEHEAIKTQNSIEVKADREQSASSEEVTIQNISKTFISADFDVTRYKAASLKDWAATANAKTVDTKDTVESEATASDVLQPDLVDTLETTSSGQSAANSPQKYSQITDDARDFIQHKLETSDMEIHLFRNEILIVDKATSTGDISAISWQLDDGNVISLIGLTAEFSEVFVA